MLGLGRVTAFQAEKKVTGQNIKCQFTRNPPRLFSGAPGIDSF